MARIVIPGSGLWSSIAGIFNTMLSELYTPRLGIYDYNDAGTGTTPISLTANVWADLTNDGAGPYSQSGFELNGNEIWLTGTDRFDFSWLETGDTIDIRLDVDITTTTLNQVVDVELLLGEGDAGEYSIPFIVQQQFKATGTYKLIRFSGIYIGDAVTKDNPAKFRIRSDSAATVRVNGWYVRAVKRGVND